MRDRSPIWIGLADLLLCMLCVVIVAVAPKEPKAAGVQEKAEYLLSSEWPVAVDADVDIWRRRLRSARLRQPRLHG